MEVPPSPIGAEPLCVDVARAVRVSSSIGGTAVPLNRAVRALAMHAPARA
jgi:hypothetical protein